MTSTDLVYAGASLRERQDYALALSKAGDLIPRGFRDPNGQPNAGKILLATEYGNALGVHPIVAINSIDIIEGNLTITPALMSGLVRTAGHKLRIRTAGTGSSLTATATLIRADDPKHPFEVTWSMADAKAAGLDGKQNWRKYPRAMLKARAISEVCREGAEDVLMGAYVAEELDVTVNEAGEVIEDAEIVETLPKPEPPRWDPAPWEDQIAYADTSQDLHKIWILANNEQVLDQPLTNGSLRDELLAKKARLEQDTAAEAPTTVADDYQDEVPF